MILSEGNFNRYFAFSNACPHLHLPFFEKRDPDKTGARLIRHARHFTLQLAEGCLTQPLFRQIVARIDQLAWHPA